MCGITDIKIMYKTNTFHLAVLVYSATDDVKSVTLLASGSWRTCLFLPRFDVICALSEYTRTAK